MDRTELLHRIFEARTKLETTLTHWDTTEMTTPDLPNGWSIKDLLAHLGWWERNGVEVYQAMIENRAPNVPKNEEINTQNDLVVASFRLKNLDEVRNCERQAFTDLVNLVETAPEDDLFDGQRFPWTGGRPFSDIIGWDTFNHYAEHFADLEKRAAERAAVNQ